MQVSDLGEGGDFGFSRFEFEAEFALEHKLVFVERSVNMAAAHVITGFVVECDVKVAYRTLFDLRNVYPEVVFVYEIVVGA